MKKRYTKIVSLVLGFGLAASMVKGCSVKSSENVVTTAAPTAAKAETTASAESGGSAAEQKKMVFWDKSEYVEGYNTMMKAKVDELNRQVEVGSSISSRSAASQPVSSATNMDILKRLSNLERRVFGSQLGNDENNSHLL